jgi:hypothetical protein
VNPLISIGLLLVSAAPPKPPALVGGFFYSPDLSDSVVFKANGRMEAELHGEPLSCDYKVTHTDGQKLKIALSGCGGGKEPIIDWTWVDKDKAKTDVICVLLSKDECADSFARSAKSREDIRTGEAKAFEQKTRPLAKGEWKEKAGAILAIGDKGPVTLDKQKEDIAVVDCLLSCDKSAGRTWCLLLAPAEADRKDPLKPNDDGIVILVAKDGELVEHEFLGPCASGLAFSAIPDPRVFTRKK